MTTRAFSLSAVAPIPFSSTVYFFAEAVLASGSAAQKQALLPKLVSGELVGAFGVSEGPGAPSPASIEASFDGVRLSGVKIPVTDGDIATHAVVLAREGQGLSLVVVALDQAGVKRETLTTLDPTRGHARLTFDKANAERLGKAGEGWSLTEAVFDRAAVLIAFEQLGGAVEEVAVDFPRESHAAMRLDVFLGCEIVGLACSHPSCGCCQW